MKKISHKRIPIYLFFGFFGKSICADYLVKALNFILKTTHIKINSAYILVFCQFLLGWMKGVKKSFIISVVFVFF